MMGSELITYTAICLSTVLTASATHQDYPRQLRTAPLPSLVDIAEDTQVFSTLAALVVKAGLAEDLSGEGPFTVFAPTNEAFFALAESAPVLANNFATSDAWNMHLATVLLYHVASGDVTSDIIVPDGCEAIYTMLNGEDIFVEVSNEISITDATGGTSMVQDPFDVMASNGVAHTIDRVLLPSWVRTNIIDLIAADGNFEIILSLLRRTRLDVALSGFGDSGNGFILFAPSDSAFEEIDASELSDDQISETLLYHVVPVIASSSGLSTGQVPTLQGNDLDVIVSDSGVTVNGISVVDYDSLANNGIVQVIDQVLIPPNSTMDSDCKPDLASLVGSQRFARAIDQARHEMSLAPWLQNSSFPELDRAAAERHLKHQIAAALDQGFVLHDPYFPEFSRLEKHNQFGLLSPDNLYFVASIETPGTYVIHGKRGTSADLQIQIVVGWEPGFDENLISPIPISELDLSALSTKPNGEFTVIVSDTEPYSLRCGENWMNNTRDQHFANSILIRESLMDWDTEMAGTWYIERVGTIGQSNPLPTPELVGQQYERAANFLIASTKGWTGFVTQLTANLPSNRLTQPRETMNGLPGQFSSAGYFRVSNQTAIIITAEESDARYQNIQLGDLWFNALDFRRRQTSLTTKQAYQSEDGKYRFVISVEDPGFKNWLDPSGSSTVFVFIRWQGLPQLPGESENRPRTPEGKVVTLEELGEELKNEPHFTPEQREEQLAARHRSSLRIPRGF